MSNCEEGGEDDEPVKLVRLGPTLSMSQKQYTRRHACERLPAAHMSIKSSECTDMARLVSYSLLVSPVFMLSPDLRHRLLH